MSKRSYTRKDGTTVTIVSVSDPYLRKKGLLRVKHITPAGWEKNIGKAFAKVFKEEIEKMKIRCCTD